MCVEFSKHRWPTPLLFCCLPMDLSPTPLGRQIYWPCRLNHEGFLSGCYRCLSLQRWAWVRALRSRPWARSTSFGLSLPVTGCGAAPHKLCRYPAVRRKKERQRHRQFTGWGNLDVRSKGSWSNTPAVYSREHTGHGKNLRKRRGRRRLPFMGGINMR